MKNFFKDCFIILDHKQKIFFIYVTILIVIASLLEILGISLIVPLITVLAEDEFSQKYYYIKNIVELIGNPSKVQLIIYFLLAINIFYFFKFIFLIFVCYVQSLFAKNVLTEVASRLISGYLRMPYSFHLNSQPSNLIRNATSENSILVLIYKSLFNLFSEIFLMSFIVIFLFFYDFYTTTIILVSFFVFGFIFYVFNQHKLYNWGLKRVELEASLLKNLIQIFRGIKDLKVFKSENFFFKQFQKNNYDLADIGRKAYVLQQFPRYYIELLTLLSLSMAIAYALIKTDGKFSDIITVMALYGFVALRVMPSVYKLLNIFNDLKFNQPVIKNLLNELNLIKKNEGEHENFSPEKFSNCLEFKNINFSYNDITSSNENFKLKDVSIIIPKGKKIGIIGKSGSGKSTFADILLGLIKPSSGEIILDSLNLTKKNFFLSSIVGHVPQSIFLIDDSILKNIAFGEKENEINKQRFKESADKAQLSEFIDNLEFKENTIVGENGTKLSGGQKQRIGIARALYKNFDIIIFDESTNALDSVTEDKVISALDKLTPEKTLVIITHKLSTIKNCDLIYEFKDGKITPESLNRT